MNRKKQFFQVGGTLSRGAACYIRRPADDLLLNSLEKGEYCLVLAPRQSGKSSLMIHCISRLEKRAIRCGIVDLQNLRDHKDSHRWFQDILYHIQDSLKLSTNCIQWWQEHQEISPPLRFQTFIEKIVLTEIPGDVVLFIDEINSALGFSFSDVFFTTIRACYNSRANKPAFKRLNFVLLGKASPSSFVTDQTQTPFNIGTSIPLEDFDQKETSRSFSTALGPEADALLKRIFYWSAGQPLLVQRLAEKADNWPTERKNAAAIDREVESYFSEEHINQDSHFTFIRDYLLEGTVPANKALLLYLKVMKGKAIREDKKSPEQTRLRLAGVITSKRGKLASRNPIYSHIFSQTWAEENRPKNNQKILTFLFATTTLAFPLWLYLIQPLFFPIFPNLPREIIRYSDQSSYELNLPLSGSHVTRVKVEENVHFEGGWPNYPTSSLPVLINNLPKKEKIRFKITLEAGLFSKTRQTILQVTHYPRWEVQQFPDARLDEIGPVKGVEAISKYRINTMTKA
jgi:hypothetical protein